MDHQDLLIGTPAHQALKSNEGANKFALDSLSGQAATPVSQNV